TITMNEGDNPNPDTAWDYVVTTTQAGYLYALFTEDTNKTIMTIKFAPPPFYNTYLPEESLDKVKAKNAFGDWRLEVWDSRVGATNFAPTLLGWELSFLFENAVPAPIHLFQGITQTNV